MSAEIIGWDKIKENTLFKNFVKIGAGKSVRLHLLDEAPVKFYLHRLKGSDNERPIRCSGSGCVQCTKPELYNKSARYAIGVYNFGSGTMQVYEAGWKVFEAIQRSREAYGNDTSKFDIQVSQSGERLLANYTVIPVPTQFNPSLIVGSKIDVLKMYQPEKEVVKGLEAAIEEF